MSDDRVIVVTTARNGTVVKVCESWQAYDEWVEGSPWEKEDHQTTDCAIYPEQD